MTTSCIPPVDARVGTVVAAGQYRVLTRLGEGGFGTVYLVETVVGGLRRALKVLHAHWAADARSRARFINEALVLEQMNHPNIARCYSAGTLSDADQVPYLLLEYVDGVPLDAAIRDGAGRPAAIEPLRAVRLAQQIASGLVAVHANQVLHRDLTPANVLIVSAGTPDERVKLVDFGIAGVLDDRTRSGVTAIGTPTFMAPEQLEGAATLDARTDLWQLGALLFLMLTGRKPYEPEDRTLSGRLGQQRRYPRLGPSPDAIDPSLRQHRDLMRLVSRLLATDRAQRPGTAIEACEALARIEHQLAPGAPADGASALLEALCAQPSDGGWWAVCRYLATQEDQSRMAASANALLASWPDALRRAPLAWWDAVKHGAAHPLWPIVRSLDASGRGLTDRDVEEMAGVAALASLTVLSLARNEIGAAGAAALARSPHLSGLVSLDLSDNRIGADGMRHLAQSRAVPALREFAARGNGIGPDGATALADGVLELESLDLSLNDVRGAGAAALASSRACRGLADLRLRDNRLGSDGVSALCVSRHLTRLRVLDVSGNEIGAAGAAALALSGNVATLTTLSLGRNCLGLEGVALLLASNRFGSLMELDVSSNTIGAQGAMTLAASPAVRRLRMLDVGDNGLGDAGLAALLGAPYLTGLRRLRLAQNGITASGVALLGVTPAELNDLDLSGNPVGPTGAMAMRGVLGRMRLSRLMVDDCGLGADGCAAIAEDAPATLVRLSLAGNAIGADGAARLAAVDAAHRLTDLDASHNDLGAAGLAALLRWPALAGLRSLAADGNGIGDHCAALVAAIAALPELADLRLRDNGLGPAAIERLGASPMATRLAALDLAFNRIADAGATTLARHCHGLRRLDLERNGLTLAAAASIWSSPAMPDLHAANLARNALAGLVDLQSLARRKVTLLEDSFARLVPQAADVAARFYERLFERYPSVKPLFAHTAMRRQQQHFVAALTLVIEHLRAPDAAAAHLRALGARHADHGAWPSHYPAVTGVLLDTLRDAMGPSWTKEVEAAWQQGLDAVSAAMIDGQQAARRAAGPELS